MASRGRGRPPRRRRAHPNPPPSALPDVPSVLPSLGPDPSSSTVDSSHALILTGDDARYALLTAESSGRTPAATTSSQRLFLNAVSHKATDGWKLIKTLPVEDLAPWFDDQNNDFNPYEMSPPQDGLLENRAVEVRWIGHPGDSPRDPRARQCIIRWNEPRPAPEVLARAIERQQPVVRWDLRCAGVHEFDFGDAGDEAEPEEAHLVENNTVRGGRSAEDGSDSSASEAGKSGAPAKIKRWHQCSTLVKLHCEVLPDDITVVHIWQQHEHPDVAPADRKKGLCFSRMRRLIFLENLRLHGIKVSHLVRETHRMSAKLLGRRTPLPEWREPTAPQLQSLYVAVKHRQLLDRNPWRATHLLVHSKINQEKVFLYHPHDFSRPDSESEFTIGLTDNYSLDSGIAYSRSAGMGSDQCWRNKSQNRAALSLLSTVDEASHMVPNPSIISTRGRSKKIQAQILENAKEIIENGWRMALIMIDKHFPSLLALKAFLKKYNLVGVFIRICQFHVVQAIIRWEWSDGRKGLNAVIGVDLKFHIIILFRSLQRSRTRDEFTDAKTKFFAGVRALMLEEDSVATSSSAKGKGKARSQGKTMQSQQVREAMYEAVREYFESNWFVEAWIDHYTDIGMPPNQTRDETWNTNNWTETAYKTFDTVFLQNRQNKRIDRLASIILNDFLPYYQYWRPRDRAPSDEVVQRHLAAYRAWDAGAVREIEPGRLYGVQQVENGETVEWVVEINPMKCHCMDYDQTGKRCLHVLTVTLFLSNGKSDNWKEVEVESEKLVSKGKLRGRAKEKKVIADNILNQEFYSVLEKIEHRDRVEQESRLGSPEPAFAPPQGSLDSALGNMGREPGRPANLKALQTGRSKTTHSPQFSARRGRKVAGRLAPNSLSPASTNPALHARSGERGDSPDFQFSTEELNMLSLDGDLRRWAPLEYLLRAEEVTLWTTILNCSEIARRDGWWFITGVPLSTTTNIIESLRWSVPVDAAELRARNLGFLAEVLEARPHNQLNHLVCFHLIHAHWTLFHHDLTSVPPQTFRLNPLQENPEWSDLEPELRLVNIWDQAILRTYLNHRRAAIGSEAWPVVDLENIDTSYEERFLGLQLHDSTTCGFWCILAAFSLLFKFDLMQPLITKMDAIPAELKELLAPVYASFGADPVGVPVDLVVTLFTKFQPKLNFETLGTHFSVRPADYERTTINHDERPSSSSPPAPIRPLLVPASTSGPETLDPGVSTLIADAMKHGFWLIGSHQLTSANIRDVRDGGGLPNVVIDAFLDLFVKDLDVNGSSGPNILIANSIIGNELESSNRNSAGMAPKKKRKKQCKYWFTQDIFLLDAMIIPWFWKKHWIVIGLVFAEQTITVYDSFGIGRPARSRATAATERVREMLLFEHQARRNQPLDSGWNSKPVLALVPQQANKEDAGIYAIWFSTKLAVGHRNTASWAFPPARVDDDRIRIINILSRAIHADPSRRNIRQLTGSGPVESSDSGVSNTDTDLSIEERSMFEAIHPRLASTDASRLPSVTQWQVARRLRLQSPEVGRCMLFSAETPPAQNLHPYIVTTFDEDTVWLTRFDGTYIMNTSIPANLKITRETWMEFMALSTKPQSLPQLEWSRLLVSPGHAFYPSPLFRYQEGLADVLQPLLPAIAAIYMETEDREINDVFETINTRFLASPGSDFYRQILGAPPNEEPFSPAEEGYFTDLLSEIRDLIPLDHGRRNVLLLLISLM
ncbi:hypothetical protein C8R46DRAFT_1207993 [Mycena filopes]|nr:hypothetical protein C8R46DRAFT_1207993 [Mycena filopes]